MNFVQFCNYDTNQGQLLMEIWIYAAEIFRDNKHRKDKVFLLLEYMQNVFSLSLNTEILYLNS